MTTLLTSSLASLSALVVRARASCGLPPAGPCSLAAVLRALPSLLMATVRRVVAPSCCAACDEPAAPTATFCARCQRTVEPLTGPFAEPSSQAKPASLAGLDSRSGPEIEPAPSPGPDVAYAPYSGALAVAIRRFKYGDRSDLAHPLGVLLRRAVRGAGLRADLVVPVPLHSGRLRERGFNQAALLAAAVASEIRAPLAARALVRARSTRAQASLDRAARLTNLDGAVHARTPAAVRGRHVVLVDDVSTTGSTLEVCRQALLAAGAARVTTVVLARRDPVTAP